MMCFKFITKKDAASKNVVTKIQREGGGVGDLLYSSVCAVVSLSLQKSVKSSLTVICGFN